MQLFNTFQTGGFKLVCIFLVAFCAASSMLYSFVYFETKEYAFHGVNKWIRWESERQQDNSSQRLENDLEISQDVERSGRLLVLFSSDGVRLRGPRVLYPNNAQIGHISVITMSIDGVKKQVSYLVNELPNGNLLLVGRVVDHIQLLERHLLLFFGWSMIANFIIGCTGAAIVGMSALRQNQAITLAVDRIIRGDMSERLPTNGAFTEFNHLTQLVNGMLDQLQRLMQEIKSVNENIAHDLRTPLTRVIANLERADRVGNTISFFREINDIVISDVKSIVMRFSALLRISELEDRTRRAGFSDTDLSKIAMDAYEYFEPQASSHDIVLNIINFDGPCIVYCDQSLIFEAVSNILDNAIKFTPPGGKIDIFLTHSPPAICIRDTGCGISLMELEAVRLRYKRGAAVENFEGFGIGLSLVDSISRLHNASFVLENNGIRGCSAIIRWNII